MATYQETVSGFYRSGVKDTHPGLHGNNRNARYLIIDAELRFVQVFNQATYSHIVEMVQVSLAKLPNRAEKFRGKIPIRFIDKPSPLTISVWYQLFVRSGRDAEAVCELIENNSEAIGDRENLWWIFAGPYNYQIDRMLTDMKKNQLRFSNE